MCSSDLGDISISSAGAANGALTIPVTLSITPAVPPTLEVGPQLLTFQGIVRNGNPAAKSFKIVSRGSGAAGWTVLPLTNSGGNWLTVSPSSGEGDATISVTPQTAGLARGLYEASIRVTNRTTGRVEVVAISLNMERNSPILELNQTSLLMTAAVGSTNIPAEFVNVVNSGTGQIDWQAKITPLSGGDWLRLGATQGNTIRGEATPLTLQAASQVEGRNLEPGIYDALVEISAEIGRAHV